MWSRQVKGSFIKPDEARVRAKSFSIDSRAERFGAARAVAAENDGTNTAQR